MHTTKNIEKFKIHELQNDIKGTASWHNQYDSAYIFVGNLNYAMNQGDIVIVFSEFGEIVDIRLVRDKQTGKSRGFAFIAYQNQKSTILAVDNFNGTQICGRTLRVDHIKKYKPPKEFLDIKNEIQGKQYQPTGPDGRGWGKYRKHTQEQLKMLSQYKQSKQQKNQMLRQQIGHS